MQNNGTQEKDHNRCIGQLCGKKEKKKKNPSYKKGDREWNKEKAQTTWYGRTSERVQISFLAMTNDK